MTMTTPTDSAEKVVAELRDVLTDWNGADIPDAELPRVDILCGTLRSAAALIESQRATIERVERERDEAWREADKRLATIDDLNADAGAWHRRAKAAEARVTALEAEKAGLVKALEAHAEAFQPFTNRPVGAPGSFARWEQDQQKAAHELAVKALSRSSTEVKNDER